MDPEVRIAPVGDAMIVVAALVSRDEGFQVERGLPCDDESVGVMLVGLTQKADSIPFVEFEFGRGIFQPPFNLLDVLGGRYGFWHLPSNPRDCITNLSSHGFMCSYGCALISDALS